MASLDKFFQFGPHLTDEYPNERQYGARSALYVFTFLNVLNFADRYVPSAVKQLIIDDLHISDFQSSLPATGMVVMYMTFAMIFGYLSDRELVDRRVILWGAAIFWSVATSLAGLSANLVQLILIRSLVGMGEAAYGTISPPMLADFYPPSERNVVYGIYFLAIPIGGALGYAFGAVLGSAYGWRVAFLACGAPGIIASILILRLNNPVRGINDRHISDSSKISSAPSSSKRNLSIEAHTASDRLLQGIHQENTETNITTTKKKTFSEEVYATYLDMIEIFSNPAFMFATAGLVSSNFALGGLADWMATYLLRYDHVSLDTAGIVLGLATIFGGLGGTFLGTKLCDYCKDRFQNPAFLVPALLQIPGAVCLLFAINISTSSDGPFAGIVALLLTGEVCAWSYIAPISALSVSCVPPHLRARSCGIQIFLIHILGDVISPPIIGAISDSTGSLRNGLQLTWISLAVTGVFWWLGSRLPKIETTVNCYDLACDEERQVPISKDKVPTYLQILREDDGFVMVEGRILRKSSAAFNERYRSSEHGQKTSLSREGFFSPLVTSDDGAVVENPLLRAGGPDSSADDHSPPN